MAPLLHSTSTLCQYRWPYSPIILNRAFYNLLSFSTLWLPRPIITITFPTAGMMGTMSYLYFFSHPTDMLIVVINLNYAAFLFSSHCDDEIHVTVNIFLNAFSLASPSAFLTCYIATYWSWGIWVENGVAAMSWVLSGNVLFCETNWWEAAKRKFHFFH